MSGQDFDPRLAERLDAQANRPADNHCADCGDGTGRRCQSCRDAYDRDCARLNARLEDR